MKLDKETLIKQRFWIIVILVVPLWLTMVCVLKFGVAGTVEEKRNEYDKATKAVSAINDPKNGNFIGPVKVKEDILKSKKDKIWEQAWKDQNLDEKKRPSPLIDWPAELLGRLGNHYFGQDISENDRREYARIYPGYAAELQREFTNMVAPVEFNGEYKSVIHTVQQWEDNRVPLLEELYLAQEDIAIQREMLRIVKEVLDTLKKFHREETPKDFQKTYPGAQGVQVFRNNNWEFTLVLEQNDKKQLIVNGQKSKIKNINPGKRTLPLGRAQFAVMQGQSGSVLFRVPVEYLLPGQDTALFNSINISKFNKSAPLDMEQVFDWHTSPIKRIDSVAMGFNSHRTAGYDLKMREIKETIQSSGKIIGQSGTGGPVGGAVSGKGATDPNAAPPQTPNKLDRYRYLDVREQVRWMPVGLALVVDQSAIQDVLGAVANSRLRIQTTQVAWSHARGIHQQQKKSDPRESQGENVAGPRTPTGDGGESGPTVGAPGRPGTAGKTAGGGPPGFTGAEARRSPITNTEQDDPNLVELAVYGIASIYERFPPPPPVPTSTADAGKTATSK